MRERATSVQSAIGERLEEVRENVASACRRANRDPAEIEILPITKGQPLEAIVAAYELGVRRIGENRVGEAIRKQRELGSMEGLRWDMVGHIQSRKTKDVVPHFDRVHSVDRLKIARYLDRYAGESDRMMPAFIECNVSGEESKYGFDLSDEGNWPAAVADFRSILEHDHVVVQGLMTMAPWTEDETIVRTTFRKLRALRDFLRDELPQGDWSELSMGMTDDYEIAVEEGATLLRLGRAIFGPRG